MEYPQPGSFVTLPAWKDMFQIVVPSIAAQVNLTNSVTESSSQKTYRSNVPAPGFRKNPTPFLCVPRNHMLHLVICLSGKILVSGLQAIELRTLPLHEIGDS